VAGQHGLVAARPELGLGRRGLVRWRTASERSHGQGVGTREPKEKVIIRLIPCRKTAHPNQGVTFIIKPRRLAVHLQVTMWY